MPTAPGLQAPGNDEASTSKAEQPPAPPPEMMFDARVCELERPVASLEDVGHCPSVGTITTPLDITPRPFTKGFKGVTDETEWFTLDFAGTFETERSGEYELRLMTDDHAMLWIDGELVLENPPPRDRRPDRPPIKGRTSILLEAGDHRFRLLYLHGKARELALYLEVIAPGAKPQPFKHRF